MASLPSEHKAPARIATGAPFAETIEQTTVSFGFPAVCNDGFNYRLNSAINLLCGGNRLFDAIDHFQYITALLLSFRLFSVSYFLHFCCVGTAQIFIPLSSPFLPFSLRGRSSSKIVD